ncbi:MAG: cyclic-di-AMP receptor [Candidatus Dormibacteria bacterium]
MKLVIAVVHDRDAAKCVEALNDRGLTCTRFESSGGFLEQKNATLFIAVDEDRVDTVVELITRHVKERMETLQASSSAATTPLSAFVPSPVDVEVHGATIIVIPVERFEKI